MQTEPSIPEEEVYFSQLNLASCFLSYVSYLMTTDVGSGVPVNQELHTSAQPFFLSKEVG